MTVKDQEHIKNEQYALAMRYIANAKDTLSNSGLEGKFYTSQPL
jgi:hypothetical protein